LGKLVADKKTIDGFRVQETQVSIVRVKIHPAIGIARLGNSPAEFFIGPETTLPPAIPAGGYKDASCRIKRQAARFRLYAYHSDGTVTELNTANAEITWTVQLANKKASGLKIDPTNASVVLRNKHVTGADRAQLNITPPTGTLVGPSQIVNFNTGQIRVWRTDGTNASETVDLGEARTDPESRLLVLGGFGKSRSPTNRPLESGDTLNNDEWYDDSSDGPVNATVKILSSGEVYTADGAWVVVAPPKYAPPLTNAITLWDRLFQFFVDNSLATTPTTTSFARDVYPILRAALDIEDVNAAAGGHHLSYINPANFPMSGMSFQATRQAIFGSLTDSAGNGGDMPYLAGGGRLTAIQYGHMQRWANDPSDGSLDITWPVTSPTISPQELDRAALFHCVGAALSPGMEVSNFLLQSSSVYSGFRLNHSLVNAGDLTAGLSLPWQTDFAACAGRWWPPNRPDEVRKAATSGYVAWDRNANMIEDWPILGFVVAQGSNRIEVERCDESFISLVTPQVLFLNVPQGAGGVSTTVSMPIVFEIVSLGTHVTFEFVSGASSGNFARKESGPFDFGPTVPGEVLTARIWINFTTGAVGSSVSDHVVIRHSQTGKTWKIPVEGYTVARTATRFALALDRSGSMSEATTTGLTKLELLVDAVNIFADMVFDGDQIGASQFNQSASPLFPVTTVDPVARNNFKSAVAGIAASGATSIGAGLENAQSQLASPPTSIRRALVVLTDGKENSPPLIADVADSIDAFTYAIGLGNANNVNVQILQALTGNRGGYLLVTGPLDGDNQFVLTKYFLQILASINNQSIATDPQGYLQHQESHRIPFLITECDRLIDVILLSPHASKLSFELETPLGHQISPSSKQKGIQFLGSDGVNYFRIRLPVSMESERPSQAGRWYAVVKFERKQEYGKMQLAQNRVPYSLSVHCVSDINLTASITQDGYRPGAVLRIHAVLTLFGVPYTSDGIVWAEVSRPDSTIEEIPCNSTSPGNFSGKLATTKPGVYSIRVRAKGISPRGWHFLREQTVTGVVYFAEQGDNPGPEIQARRMRNLAKRETEKSIRWTAQ
jgi:L-Lysine epsilon oxidase N-terminal/L-lysine epsilon oxidase C-terminal domain/von Willebrand factor type A domain